MISRVEQIGENLREIRHRIAEAAESAGRHASNVRLVAVTKYVDPPTTLAVVDAGCHLLGESRPQELWQKAALLQAAPIEWHLIGHLQRNKVDRTLRWIRMIHSVDSLRLLSALDKSAERQQLPPIDILLEINTSGDSSKHGWTRDELPEALRTAAGCQRLRVRGLMTMAAGSRDPGEARRNFAALRELRDAQQGDLPDGIHLDELSMGMSGDYTVAIEEGATLVRVGSAIFEGCAL